MRAAPALVFLAGCGFESEPVAPCEAPEAAAHARDAEYAAMLDEYAFGENTLTGAILGVQRDGEALWVGAVGRADLEHDAPMQACTRFRAGSVAKMALGAAAAKLAEGGTLHLDDPVGTYVPDADRIGGSEEITLRHLLNHTSGLLHPSGDDLDFQLAVVNDPDGMAATSHREKLERYVYGRPLRFAPGTDSHYSNAGYWLLAEAIEASTGQPWDEAVHDVVFAPLGLEDSSWEATPDVARGYARLGDGVVDTTAWDRADSHGDPAGGLYTTAADLAVFGHALLAGEVVGREMLAEMQVTPSFPSCPDGDCGYGLGFESLRAYPSVGWGKNGSLLGADANVFTFPDEGLTVVMFTNLGGGSRKDAIRPLWD